MDAIRQPIDITPPPSLRGILSPFRYPGGKSSLAPVMVQWVRATGARLYVEPFAGGASVGLAVAASGLVDRVVLSEIDPAVAAFWRTVFEGDAESLANRILRFKIDDAVAYLASDFDPDDQDEVAFRTLVRNRIAHSGVMAGGSGVGKTLGARWYPETLARRIRYLVELRDIIRFEEADAFDVLARFSTEQGAAMYLDPPYSLGGGPGSRLYNHHQIDHARVFEAAASAAGPTLLSYNSSRSIEYLAEMHDLRTRDALIRTGHRYQRELLIGSNESLQNLPDVPARTPTLNRQGSPRSQLQLAV